MPSAEAGKDNEAADASAPQCSARLPHILLLPGLHGTDQLFGPLLAALSREATASAVSYPFDPRLGTEDYVALAAEALPDRPVILVGESFSGPIAVELAVRHPGRVVGLVLAASFVLHPRPRWFANLLPLMRGAWFPTRFALPRLLGADADPQVRTRLIAVRSCVPPAVLISRLSLVLRVDVREQLRMARCPVLCLWGTRDRLVGRRAVGRIKAIRPDAELQTLPAPHMLLATHAEDAARLILDFARRIRARAPSPD